MRTAVAFLAGYLAGLLTWAFLRALSTTERPKRRNAFGGVRFPTGSVFVDDIERAVLKPDPYTDGLLH